MVVGSLPLSRSEQDILAGLMANRVVEGWSMAELISYAVDSLTDYYSRDVAHDELVDLAAEHNVLEVEAKDS